MPSVGAIREIRGVEDLQEHIAGQSDYPFKAILLASHMDEDVIDFFKQYSSDLSQLTGKTCLMYALQKLSSPNTQHPGIDDSMKLPISVSPEKDDDGEEGDVFELARQLGVGVDKLPCLVVFEELQNDIQDLAIVGVPNIAGDPLKDKLQFFVSRMDECCDGSLGYRLPCFKEKLRNDLIKTTAKGLLRTVLSHVLSAGSSRLVNVA